MHTAFQPKIQYVYIKADTIVIKRVIYIVFLFAFITTPPLKPKIIHKRNIYHKLILLQDILLVIRICQHQIILISIIVLSWFQSKLLMECPLLRRIVPAVCHDKHIKRYLLSCFVCKVCNDASCLHSISHFLRLDVFCRGLTPSSSQNFLLGSGTQVSQSGPEYSDNSCFSCMLTFWTYLMRCTYPWHWIKYSTKYNRCHPIFSLSW